MNRKLFLIFLIFVIAICASSFAQSQPSYLEKITDLSCRTVEKFSVLIDLPVETSYNFIAYYSYALGKNGKDQPLVDFYDYSLPEYNDLSKGFGYTYVISIDACDILYDENMRLCAYRIKLFNSSDSLTKQSQDSYAAETAIESLEIGSSLAQIVYENIYGNTMDDPIYKLCLSILRAVLDDSYVNKAFQTDRYTYVADCLSVPARDDREAHDIYQVIVTPIIKD